MPAGRQSPSGAADGHPRMPKACGRGIPAALGTGSVRTCTPERGGCRCRRRTETIILPFYEKDTFIALFCGCRAGCAGRGTVYARGAAVRTSGDAAGHRRPGAATGLASGRQPFRGAPGSSWGGIPPPWPPDAATCGIRGARIRTGCSSVTPGRNSTRSPGITGP